MSEELQVPEDRSTISGNSQVALLLRRMDQEMRSKTVYNGYIDELQMLVSNRENSEFKGLEEKLEAVGRKEELEDAEFDLQISLSLHLLKWMMLEGMSTYYLLIVMSEA